MDLATVAATLRAYVEASGALAATAVVEGGMVAVDADGRVQVDPADAALTADASPVPLGLEVRRLPPFAVDAGRGEVSGPLGGLEHLAEGVRALARAVGGGRSVALVEHAAADGETTFALSAREGEGIVVVIGDEQYEMDAAWPPPRGG